MTGFWALAVPGLLMLPTPSAAQTRPEAEPDIVVVAATKDLRLNSKQLRGAIAAFRKYRARYAPDSRLWFSVAPRGPGTLAGVELALVNGSRRHPLPIGADGRILFPDVAGDDWRLVSNRPAVPLRLSPWVLSPGMTATDIRLGDLQVQCRVGWAMQKQSVSIVAAGMFDAIGGCASSRMSIYQDFAKPIAAAAIQEGGKRAPLSVWRDTLLKMPTSLKDYTPEARVKLTYR